MKTDKPFIRNALFIKSSSKLGECPNTDQAEFAFTGRSNVGKSSLINLLTGRKNLAKTSSTPGKTTLINHYHMDEKWFLVDLPGYGYAKRSKSERKKFGPLIEDYILGRENLYCLFALIDSRLNPQPIDLSFIHWLGVNSIPFCVVFTKTDKLGKNQLHQNIQNFQDALLETWEELPRFFFTSSQHKTGREELLGFVEKTLEQRL